MEKRRNLTLDIQRIVAVLLVVMIHTSAKLVINYDKSSIDFILGNVFDSISRIGVPLFIMVSGALMLDEDREITLRNHIFKKVKDVFVLIIFWAFLYAILYYVLVPLFIGEAPNVKDVINAIITGHYHMWYLYMIIGLYFATPFIRCITIKKNKRLVFEFISISLIVQFFAPVIKGLSLIWEPLGQISSFISKFNMQFFGGCIAYYLTGWYIMHNDVNKKLQRYIIYPASVVSVLLTIVYVQLTGDYDNAYSYLNIFVYIYSVGVFCLIKNLSIERCNKKIKELIVKLSNLCFGVYIIHVIPLMIFNYFIPYNGNPLLYLISTFMGVSMVSFVCCYFMSKIPIVRKLVRM